MLAYLIVVPALLCLILYRNRSTLHTEQTKQQLGTLYMNYETSKNSVFHFTMVFLYRRLVFAFLVGCSYSVVLQIYVACMSSVLMLCYILHWGPMEADQFDFLAVFNEAALLFSCYLLFLYTDYVPDPEQRYEFGNIFMYTLFVNFGTNILLLVNEVRLMVTRQCKRKLHHRKVMRARRQYI